MNITPTVAIGASSRGNQLLTKKVEMTENYNHAQVNNCCYVLGRKDMWSESLTLIARGEKS
jgi:hypothetical protein